MNNNWKKLILMMWSITGFSSCSLANMLGYSYTESYSNYIIDPMSIEYAEKAEENREIASYVDHWAIVRNLDEYLHQPDGYKDLSITRGICDSFANPHCKGVVIYSDEGFGGFAAPTSIIEDLLIQLKKKYDKPLIYVGANALSGSYAIANLCDRIYLTSESGTAGSIGAIFMIPKKNHDSPLRKMFTGGSFKFTSDDEELLDQEFMKETSLEFLNIQRNTLIRRKDKINIDLYREYDFDKAISQRASISQEVGIIDGVMNLQELKDKLNCEFFDYKSNSFIELLGSYELLNKIHEAEAKSCLTYNRCLEILYHQMQLEKMAASISLEDLLG